MVNAALLNSSDSRRDRFLGPLGPTARVLEIGALNRPTLAKSSANVKFADFADKAKLQSLYSIYPGFDIAGIVEPDYVIVEGDYVGSIKSVSPDEEFDLIIGSHVAEHIPDFVGWLGQMYELLAADGVLSLIIPDKRFTFDIIKHVTSVAEWLTAHSSRFRRPSAEQIYKHVSLHVPLNDASLWNVPASGMTFDLGHSEQLAWDITRGAVLSGSYFDSHCSFLTPSSLYENLLRLDELAMMPFEIDLLEDTVPGAIDFFVRLRKVPVEKRVPIRDYRTSFNIDLPYRIIRNGNSVTLKGADGSPAEEFGVER